MISGLEDAQIVDQLLKNSLFPFFTPKILLLKKMNSSKNYKDEQLIARKNRKKSYPIWEILGNFFFEVWGMKKS